MTEFKHVTTTVEEIGRAKINRSKTRLYVNEDAIGWSKANQLVKKELSEVSPTFFYKTQSRIYLWENYFKNAHEVRTLRFWEKLLDDLSDVESLRIHDQTKTVIRKTLFDIIGH